MRVTVDNAFTGLLNFMQDFLNITFNFISTHKKRNRRFINCLQKKEDILNRRYIFNV